MDKYKIDSVKLAKLDYFDSYNSSYWDGKPREKIEIEAVGLTDDDYNAYLGYKKTEDYKVDKDKRNPFKKIDYYIASGSSEGDIRADIDELKRLYPNSEFSKRSQDDIYNEISGLIKAKQRIPTNPMVYLFSAEALLMTDSEKLAYIKNYRKDFPNDGIFYSSETGDLSRTQAPGQEAKDKTKPLSDEALLEIINNYLSSGDRTFLQYPENSEILKYTNSNSEFYYRTRTTGDTVYHHKYVSELTDDEINADALPDDYEIPYVDIMSITHSSDWKNFYKSNGIEVPDYVKDQAVVLDQGISDSDGKIEACNKEIDALEFAIKNGKIEDSSGNGAWGFYQTGENTLQYNGAGYSHLEEMYITYTSPTTGKECKINYYEAIQKLNDLKKHRVDLKNNQKLLKLSKASLFNNFIENLPDTDDFKQVMANNNNLLYYDLQLSEPYATLYNHLTERERSIYRYLIYNEEVGDHYAQQYLEAKLPIFYGEMIEQAAQEKISVYVDKDGNLRDGFFSGAYAFSDGFTEGWDEFWKNVNAIFPWNEVETDYSFDDIVTARALEILKDKYPEVAIAYNVGKGIGNYSIPTAVSILSTIATRNPDTGFTVFNALTAVNRAGEVRINASKEGHEYWDSYIAGMRAGTANFLVSYYVRKVPFLNPDKESAFVNIFKGGLSKGSSSMLNYVVDTYIEDKPLDLEELWGEGIEGFCTGILTATVLNVTHIRIKTSDGIKFVTIPVEERSKLSQFLNKDIKGQTAVNILKVHAPVFWKSLTDVIDMDEALKPISEGIHQMIEEGIPAGM